MEEEKKKGAGWTKRYWWVPFAFIFMFLLAGGLYFISMMRQSAGKLAGGDNYDKFSANNAVYEDGAVASANTDFFALPGEEAAKPAVQAAATEKEGADLSPRDAADKADAAGSVQFATSGGGKAAPEASAQAGDELSLAAKLKARGSPLGGAGAQGSKSSGQARVTLFNNGPAAGTAASGSGTRGAGQVKGGKGGVLDALKGAFRSSVYGSRIASQDSAKNWIAKSFDATPEAELTIQYDEKMRTQLDVVNPNSIPQFLRDQDISAAGASSLKSSKVSAPGAVAEKEASADGEAGLAESLIPGMMNTMFSALTPKSKKGSDDSQDPLSKSDVGTSRGVDKQDTGTVDEYGYVSYGPADGFQTIYDSSGKFMGCTDNAAGLSIPSGSPGCPQ